jgi:maleate cis-trans isomerase
MEEGKRMRAYGEIATIGFIGPPRTNGTVLHEAFRLAPPGVTWVWSTMGLPEFGQLEFDQALALAESCAKELANREVSVIVMTGIPLMTSKGAPFHQTMERNIAEAVGHRIPVTTDLQCVLASFAAMNMRQIALSSIYQRYIQDNLIRYFDHYGIRTLADEALSYALADCMTKPSMTTAYDTAEKALARAPKADGLFIACPQWPVIGHIERLEREHGIPVVTHLSAIMWGALARIGAKAPGEGFGRMLREFPDWPAEIAKSAA